MGEPRTIDVDDRLCEIIAGPSRSMIASGRSSSTPLVRMVCRKSVWSKRPFADISGSGALSVLDDLVERRGTESQATDEEAMELAISEIRAARAEHRRARGA